MDVPAQDETENHAGFFVHDEVKIARKFAVVGDYRADYVPYLEPRRAVAARLGPLPPEQGSRPFAASSPPRSGRRRSSSRTSASRFSSRSPAAALISEGRRSDNPSFKVNPEQIFTTELGYLNSESDYFTFDSAFFYNHANNLIELAPNRARVASATSRTRRCRRS